MVKGLDTFRKYFKEFEEQYAFRFVGKEVMIFPLQIVVYKYIIKYKIITRLEVFICHKQCRN